MFNRRKTKHIFLHPDNQLLYKVLEHMTNLADNVIALQSAVTALATQVAAITPSAPIDLTALTTAVTAVQTTVNDIDSKVTPSVAPTA